MKKTLLFLAVAMFACIVNGQVTNGLIAQYSFNDGNANDEIGGNNGTVVGAVLTTDRFGNSNHAYSFDGMDDYIIVPQDTDNDLNLMVDGLSISAWINTNTLPSTDIASIVTKWCGASSEQYGIFMNTSGQNLVAIRVVNNAGITNASILSTGSWYHIVFTFDKITNEHKVYIDNTNTLTQSVVGTYANSTDTTSLSFGAQACDNNGSAAFPSRFFNGKIDDIRIYNRVLNLLEVDSLFNETDPMIVGVADLPSNKNAVAVYPNPANNEIKFSAQANVQLTSVTGQTLATQTNVNSLDISGQPAGIYFVTLTDNKGRVLQRSKVVKE